MSKDYTQGFSFGNMFKNLHKTDHSNAGQFFKNMGNNAGQVVTENTKDIKGWSVDKNIKENATAYVKDNVVNYATNKVVDEFKTRL